MAAAVAAAEDAFWSSIAVDYDEARSGDLSPETSMAMAEAMRVAVTEWVKYNVDVDEDEVPSNFTTIMLHRIEYFYRDHADMKLTEGDEEHIAYSISQGISEGELCTIDAQDEEIYGYWGINN